MTQAVQVYEGQGKPPITRVQQWEVQDHSADDDGISLYGVDESCCGDLQRLLTDPDKVGIAVPAVP